MESAWIPGRGGQSNGLSGQASDSEVRDQTGVWRIWPEVSLQRKMGGNAVLPILPLWIHQRPLMVQLHYQLRVERDDRSYSKGPLTSIGKWNQFQLSRCDCDMLEEFSPPSSLPASAPSHSETISPTSGLPWGSAQLPAWLQNVGFWAFVPTISPLLGFEFLKGRAGASLLSGPGPGWVTGNVWKLNEIGIGLSLKWRIKEESISVTMAGTTWPKRYGTSDKLSWEREISVLEEKLTFIPVLS